MSRPIKYGLDYFPFDVDFFANKKIKRLRAKYGNDGITVYIYLLTQIYHEGYYIVFDDDLILDISDELNISENSTMQILNFLLSRSLFDGKLAKSDKVLTAKSVQRRFQEAKKGLKRDVEVEAEYWLLDESETLSFIKVRPSNNKSEINGSKSEKNGSKSGINSTKESKEKKSKVNESKENSDEPDGSAPTPPVKKPVRHKYGEYKHVMLTDEQYSKLVEDFGEVKTADYIRKCDEYCEQHGKHYSNYYLTIRKWIKRDEEKGGRSSSSKQRHDNSGASYDLSEWEKYAFEHDPNLKGG